MNSRILGRLTAVCLALSGAVLHAQTHPFLIVREDQYAELQALSVGANARQPWTGMRNTAIGVSNGTTISPTANIDSRAGNLTKIMDSTAMSYILDPANRNKYRDRFYTYLNYWDPAQSGSLIPDISKDSWGGSVAVGGAFFSTVIAMDIIYNDPNTTSTQQAQRAGFIALMERPGGVGTMGPATFFTTTIFDFHLTAHAAARGIWALWKGGTQNNPALNAAVDLFRNEWLRFITADGVYTEYVGYSLARSGEPSRYHKGGFQDVLVHLGIDPGWYSNPKMVRFYEWMASSIYTPNRYTWPIGDGSYAPAQNTYLTPFDRASKFSTAAAENGAWQMNGAAPNAKLFSYINWSRTPVTPKEPVSRIFPDGGAFLRQKNGGTNSLAVVLTNLKAIPNPGGMGHIHKQTNSLSMAAFGEILLRGPGYNGWGSAASNATNFGFDFSYVNNHAISQNIALFNYNISNPLNPSFTNDHPKKHGGQGVRGLLSDGVDYAVGDTSPVTDANRAISNGQHIRHTVTIHPQDGVNGYVCSMDELIGAASATTGQLAWHPYSDSITTNADNSSNDRYEWRIRQRANTVDQLYFSVFMPTAPTSKQQYDGLFADGSNSFVGKYIFNGYALDSTSKRKNVLTMLFPRKEAQPAPAMARIDATAAGQPVSQAAAFAFLGGVTDFVMESSGAHERTMVSATLDPVGAAARGKAVVYRKTTDGLSFYFVASGRSFKNTPTGFTQGFASDADVDLHVKGSKGSIVSPGTPVTFYYPGTFAVRLNGSVLAPLQGGNGFTRVSIPAGTHEFQFESIVQSGNTLFGLNPAGGAPSQVNLANPENLFTNPGFEGGAASPWTFSNTDRVTINNSVGRSGNNSVSIVGGTGGVGLHTTITLKRNTPYLFSAWALESASNTNSYVTLYGATTPDPNASFLGTTPVWQQINIPFTPTAGTGPTRNVQFYPWFSSGSPGTVHFDDFDLRELMAPGTSAELGTRFKSDRHANITGLRVWRPANGPSSYTLNLWDDTGARIAQVTQAATGDAGWVVAPLAVPVAIVPGRTYTVSYGVPAGSAYQAEAGGLSTRVGPPMLGTLVGGNGVHALTGNTFPDQPSVGTNYWADITFDFVPSPPAPADRVVAHFTDGEGFTDPQQFPGSAGDGWTAAWVPSAGVTGGILTDSPLSNAGAYQKTTRTSGSSEQHGIYRQWSAAVRPDDQFFRLTFDVRLDSDLTQFNAATDNLSIAGSSAAGASTSANSTFFIRALGAAAGSLGAREWGVYSRAPGDPTTYDVTKLRPTGMFIQPGTLYRFTIDVYGAPDAGSTAGKTHGTYDVTISNGSETVTVTGSGFRASVTRAGTYLSFTTQQSLVTNNLAFSVDSIEIAPLVLSPPLTPLEIWQNEHFAGQLTNPALEATIWGMMADPDSDGMTNLMEYALARDPWISEASPVQLGTATLTNNEGGDPYSVLTLKFFRARAELNYIVEGGDNLSEWLPVAENPPSVNSEVTVEDTESIGPHQRFLRLRVVQP